MPLVTMPDGVPVNFPDDMPPEQIKGLIASKFPDVAQTQQASAPERPSYFDRVGQAYSDSVKPAAARLMAPFLDDQQRQDLQQAGDLPADRPNNLAQSINQGPVGAGTSALYSFMAPIAPLIQDAVGGAADAVGATPSQMENVQAVMNVMGPAGMRGIGKSLGNAEIPSLPASVKNLAKDTTSGRPTAFMEKARDNFITDLVQEKPTPANIRNNALKYKSGGGLMNKTQYMPDSYEQAVAKTVSEIPEVQKGNLVSENIAAVDAAKNAEAESLKTVLDQANIPVEPRHIVSMGQKIADGLGKNPLIKKGGSTVKDMLYLAQKAIDDNPKTAAGLLQARKDFDAAIKDFQPTALDTTAPAKAFSYTSKIVRKAMNDTIEEVAPLQGVKESLAKQNHMYTAIDNMATKLPEQVLKKPNRFARASQSKVGKAAKYGAGAAGVGGAGTYLYNKVGGQ